MAEYRVFVASRARYSKPPTHIGEVTLRPGARWISSRFGTSLCNVRVPMYPESGDMGKVENATCQACQRKYRKLQATS